MAATAFAVWLVFWPGIITPDSNQTIYQAETGLITDWWTPIGAALLHGWTKLGLGIGSVYGVGVISVVLGTYLCARFALRRVPAAVVTLIICLFPPIYGELSGISRDVFFLGFALLGFGLLGRLVRDNGRSRHAQVWLAGAALACELFAFLCRQNGIACVFAVLLGLALWWRSGPTRTKLTRRQTLGATAVAGVASAVLGLATFPVYGLVGVRSVHAERFLYTYDLASISVLSHHDRFPAEVRPNPPLGWVSPRNATLGSLDRLFNAGNAITLYPNNAAGGIDFVSTRIASREASVLRRAWLSAVSAEPLDYAWGRLRLLAIQLGLWEHPTDAYIPLTAPRNFGHPLQFSGNYLAASTVLADFVGPNAWISLDLPWTWLVLMLIVMVALARRLERLAWFATLLPVAVITNYGILLFVAVAAGFRYISVEVPATLLLVVYLLAALAAAHNRCSELVDPRYTQLLSRQSDGLSSAGEEDSPESREESSDRTIAESVLPRHR